MTYDDYLAFIGMGFVLTMTVLWVILITLWSWFNMELVVEMWFWRTVSVSSWFAIVVSVFMGYYYLKS